MTETNNLRAPFPYFGGKQRAVDLVWPRLGTVDNYVEPFCGSLAMLLGAPDGKRIETINDANGFVVNFWRAIQSDPESVAAWADWPVTEIDLEARHGWLVNRSERLRWSLQDPDYYDAKMAGWWVWGACAWIGSGWCLGKGPWLSNGVELSDRRQLPHVGDAGRGINRKLPHVGNAGRGINRQLPHVGNAGMGINRKLPHVGDAGRGINRKLPHVGNAGRGEFILNWFIELSSRLRDVRICCGDWSRVVTPVVTSRHGTSAVFLDPPYDAETICKGLYAEEGSVSSDVRKWCLENGNNPDLRIILCGYADEHDMPGWSVINGKATNGGYGNSAGNQNHKRETLWVSPYCVNELGL
jgi:hypothetical protein